MKELRFAQHNEVVSKADAAIVDSDHRDALLQELLDGLNLSDQTRRLLFTAPRDQVAVAEKEILTEVLHRQLMIPGQPGEARKKGRPVMMRGLMI